MSKCLAARSTSVSPSDDEQDLIKFRKLTWAATVKRRLFTHNILPNSGPSLQKWVLRTQTSIEDLRLQFLETEKKQRIAAEHELELATDAGGRVDPAVGRLFLPDT